MNIPANAKISTTVKVHVVEFKMTVTDILYRIGLVAQTKPYSVTYKPVDPDVPVFTYSCDLKQDTGAGYQAPKTYAGATLVTASQLVSVYDLDASRSGRYKM